MTDFDETWDVMHAVSYWSNGCLHYRQGECFLVNLVSELTNMTVQPLCTWQAAAVRGKVLCSMPGSRCPSIAFLSD